MCVMYVRVRDVCTFQCMYVRVCVCGVRACVCVCGACMCR